MQDVMLDLETLGNRPGSVIVAIGAVKMDLVNGVIGDTFYRVIDPADAQSQGLTIDAATVAWWLGQSDAARMAISAPGGWVKLLSTLGDFAAFIGTDARVWGNGADFDNALLAAAYQACSAPLPWRHWNSRCYRTCKSLFPAVKIERAGTHHNALDDAISQAEHLVRIMKAMRAGADTVEIVLADDASRTEAV